MNKVIDLKRAGELLIKRHKERKISKKKLVQLAVTHKTWVTLYYERMGRNRVPKH